MKTRTLLTGLVATTVLASTAGAAPLAASSFTNHYDGNEIWDGTSFVNGWSATASPNAANPSLSGADLTVTTPDVNGWIQQDSGTSDWELHTGSWTFEAEITISDADTGLALWLDPGTSGTIVYVGDNGLGAGANGLNSNQSYSSDSNIGTHVFRVAFDSGAGTISLWRDGALVTSGIALGNPGGGPRLIIGDCCSGGGGLISNSFVVGYAAYDTTGAYEPVPEPGSLALLGLSGLAMLRRRRA